MKPKNFEEIKKELSPLKKYQLVLYGSYLTEYFNQRSDIDIAVVTKIKDPKKNSRIWFQLLGKVPPCYDLRIFELLPLNIKADIFKNYRVVFGDCLELSEYFYHFRKLWKDVEKRYEENQFKSFKEKLKILGKIKHGKNQSC